MRIVQASKSGNPESMRLGAPEAAREFEEKIGADIMMDDAFVAKHRKGMGAEDFPFFTTDPPIPSVYFSVGGTPKADIDAEAAGGPKVPSHHSPFFKNSPAPSFKTGVEATVLALLDLMKK